MHLLAGGVAAMACAQPPPRPPRRRHHPPHRPAPQPAAVSCLLLQGLAETHCRRHLDRHLRTPVAARHFGRRRCRPAGRHGTETCAAAAVAAARGWPRALRRRRRRRRRRRWRRQRARTAAVRAAGAVPGCRWLRRGASRCRPVIVCHNHVNSRVAGATCRVASGTLWNSWRQAVATIS